MALYATCDGCKELLPVKNPELGSLLRQKQTEQLRILTPEDGPTDYVPYTLYLCEPCHYAVGQTLDQLKGQSQ